MLALKKRRQTAPPPLTLEDTPDYESSGDLLQEEEELFGAHPQSSTARVNGAPLHDAKSPELVQRRAELFKTLYSSTLDTLNQRGRMRQPPRRSTVVRLTALSESKEDLENVLEVVAAWRSVACPPDAKTCDEFIGERYQ